MLMNVIFLHVLQPKQHSRQYRNRYENLVSFIKLHIKEIYKKVKQCYSV